MSLVTIGGSVESSILSESTDIIDAGAALDSVGSATASVRGRAAGGDAGSVVAATGAAWAKLVGELTAGTAVETSLTVFDPFSRPTTTS